MRVTVVIPCLNEATYIKGLLSDLEAQQGGDFEVIVVDSESRDDTVAVARSFRDRLPLRVVEGPRGVARARNAGAALAEAPWIMFMDADLRLPEPHFIRRLVELAEQRELVTASAPYRIKDATPLDRLGIKLAYGYQKLWQKTQHPVACYLILTRTDRFRQVGGFDEKLRVGEDYDYVTRSAGPGRRFRYLEDVFFYMSLRRYHQKGKVKFFLITAGYEVYRLSHGYRIERDPFNYQFGEHEERK